MSMSQAIKLPCPACGTPVDAELVLSVNVASQPEARQAILDGSFQRRTCRSCSTQFCVDPEFTYVDLARGQYIGVWPAARRGEWQACAQRCLSAFERAFAGSPAQVSGLAPRVVFGWPALQEKLLAKDAGIDDRTLEVAKLAVVSSLDDSPLPGRRELRLVALQDGDPVLAWVDAREGTSERRLKVPRTLISEIDADPATWQALRDDVADGLVVDFQRDLLAS